MTSKSVFALAAILTIGSLSLATNASARDDGGHGGGGYAAPHFGAGHGGAGPGPGGRFEAGRPGGRILPGHGPGGRFAAGPQGRAFGFGGHRRHFWHGRWWDYGVGPCWVWSDVYSAYVWACD